MSLFLYLIDAWMVLLPLLCNHDHDIVDDHDGNLNSISKIQFVYLCFWSTFFSVFHRRLAVDVTSAPQYPSLAE